jgi:preprotein translocase subunit SecG
MDILLLILHILACLALVGIVLLQGGKGAEVGATFGAGASQTIFGASGGQTFLGKMTTGVAVIFMLTSLALAFYWGRPGSSSIMPEQVAAPPAQSMPTAPPVAPTMPAPAQDAQTK